MSFFFPTPVSKETFPAAWSYANRKLRWAKKRNLIARVVLPLTHPFYTIAMAFLSFGIFYDHSIPLVTKYLNKQPDIVALWRKFQEIIYVSAETETQKGIVWAILLYLIPFALSVALALLICAFYHPRGQKMDPNDSPAEQARQMCIMLRNAKTTAKRPKSNVVSFCNFAFAAIWCVIILGFVLFCQKEPSAKVLIEENMSRFNVALFIAFVVLALGYWLLSLPLTLAQRLLSMTIVPKKVLSTAENWFYRCEEQENPSTERAPEVTNAAPAAESEQSVPAQEN